MAIDVYLQIDGIKGESTDSKHKDEIDMSSFSWGATQVGAHSAGGGGGAEGGRAAASPGAEGGGLGRGGGEGGGGGGKASTARCG